MPMQFSAHEILETIRMVQMENLDIRTITMGISLRDCSSSRPEGRRDQGVRQDLSSRRPARRGRRRDPARIRRADHQQASVGDPRRARRRVERNAGLHPVRAGTRSRRSRSGREFPRRIFSARPQGHDARRRSAARVAPAGAQPDGARVRIRERRLDEGRHQHGRGRSDGPDRLRHGAAHRRIRTGSAAPSSSCSATLSKTIRSWPAPFTASGNRNASSTLV